ncbi:MAG: YcxB family protein [Acholeplasmatales bacterium]|nr:YcxB family protein [Acholeplasmatales bacterium]
MEKIIIKENEREFSKDDLNIASKEVFLHMGFLTLLSGIVITIIGIVVFGISFIFNMDMGIMVPGIVIIVCGIIFIGMYFYMLYKTSHREYKNTKYKYIFYEDDFRVSVESETEKNHAIVKYGNLYKVVRKKNYTFLFINKMKSYFFLNSDFDEEFFKFLKSKVVNYKD